MDAETRTVVRAGLDASAYTAGAAQVAAANERIAQSGEAVVRTQEAAEGAARRKSSAIERLQASLDQTYRAQQQFERAQTQINAAMERGAISAQRAAELQQLAQQRYLGAGTAANTLAAANDNAGRSTARFGQVLGQAGFQVQDFASQVMAGGNAMVAFGQQGSQLLGVFGTGGAIAGAVLTVGILAYQLLAARDATDDLAKSQDGLGQAMQKSIEFFETATERVARLAQEARSSIVVSMIPEMMRLEREIGARERALEVLARDREERIRASGNLPGFNPDAVLREPIERARRELAELREQLRGLEQERERVMTAPSGADRDAAEKAIERIREEQRREAERAARDEERERDRAARDAERQRQAEEREQDRARQAREREEERARERREREEAAALERQRREAERTTDDIVRYGADAFADMFDANGRGWRGMLDTFEATFRRTFARMAAEAIIRPIIQPIVAGLIGQPGSGGTMMGGLTSMLGLSSMGSMLGLGGLGAGVSGLLATPLMAGSAGLSAGGLSGAGGLAALEAAGGAAATSGGFVTLGSVLGPAALGAVGGGVLASMTGGNATGGALGGGMGAAAGFMLGGPVGALIGGAGGGLLGGMFGPSGNRPGFYNLTVEAGADGMLAAGNAGGKRAGEQLAALQQQTAQQMAAINQQMAALGLRASGSVNLGANVTGANQVSGLDQVTTQLRLAAADARIQGAIDRVGGGTFGGQLGAAQSADALVKQLEAFAQAARDASDPLGAVRRQFDGVRDSAQRLGFGLDEVQAAQDRAIREATARLVSPIVGSLGGLADYARSLRTANDNTGNPLSRLAAAEAEFERLSSAARGGDATAIGRFQQAAEQFRGLSRQVFGTGQGFAANEGRIIAALEQIGSVNADTLTASALAAVQREQTDTLVTALAGVREEVARLRREVQQAQRNPLVA